MEYFYMGLGIVVIVTLLLVAWRGRFKKPTATTAIATILIVMGIIFSDAGRVVSYSLFGAAILISIIDHIRSRKLDIKGEKR